MVKLKESSHKSLFLFLLTMGLCPNFSTSQTRFFVECAPPRGLPISLRSPRFTPWFMAARVEGGLLSQIVENNEVAVELASVCGQTIAQVIIRIS
jgi:hypothetical protein